MRDIKLDSTTINEWSSKLDLGKTPLTVGQDRCLFRDQEKRVSNVYH